jgi:hypothetical protein
MKCFDSIRSGVNVDARGSNLSVAALNLLEAGAVSAPKSQRHPEMPEFKQEQVLKFTRVRLSAV